MFMHRLEQQNILTTNQKWNEEIMEDESVKELLCINEVNHRQPHISREMNEYEQHWVECYQNTDPVISPHQVQVPATPTVVGKVTREVVSVVFWSSGLKSKFQN